MTPTHSGTICVGRSAAGLALLALALLAGRAAAQPPGSNLPAPRLLTLVPPGAKAGTTIEVTFTGTDLEEPAALLFSHPAIKAEPVAPPPPPPPDPKKPPQPKPKPAVTKFKVTVPADVPLGFHGVRLVGKWGVSNPRAFVVGDRNEAAEKEPNNDVEQAQRVALNTTVNGAMANQVDVDYFVFGGKKGQRVVISCLASSIDSRFNPGLEVYDVKQKLIAKNRNYQGDDALTEVVLPEDGDYFIRLYEFTHLFGNQESFYRLSVTTAPWIDAIVPSVVEPGKPAQVTVWGRNLPGGQPDPAAVLDGAPLEKITVTVTPPADAAARTALTFGGYVTPGMSGLDGFEYRLRGPAGSSNPYFLMLARAPVAVDNGKNETAETAQAISLPCEIAGRLEKRRDRDWYAFDAKAGQVYGIELIGDRIGASGDLYFVLRNAANKQVIVEQDDNPDALSNKLYARTDDPPAYRFAVPADGKYQVQVASRTGGTLAGPRHNYRLRITPEQPDFRLIVMGPGNYRPRACIVGQGGNANFTVLAWRRDGFNGEIALSVEGLPKGVTCPAQIMGTGLRQTLLVVSAAADAPAWAGQVKVKGTATINGKPVVHEARPASIVWPNQPNPGLPRNSRLARGLFLAVRDKAPYGLTASADKPEVVHGASVTITAKLNRISPDFKAPLQVRANFNLMGPPNYLPQNLNLPAINIAPGQAEGKLTFAVPANVPPGVYNVVLHSQAQMPYNKDPMAKQKPNVLVTQPSTPVTLTIIPKTLASVSASAPQPNVKAGAQTEVVVTANRQFGYAGEFKVQFVLPQGVQGLSAAEVTIPAGQNQAKLIVKADAAAAPGGRANLIARVTGVFNGKTPITQEAKFNLNVVK